MIQTWQVTDSQIFRSSDQQNSGQYIRVTRGTRIRRSWKRGGSGPEICHVIGSGPGKIGFYFTLPGCLALGAGCFWSKAVQMYWLFSKNTENSPHLKRSASHKLKIWIWNWILDHFQLKFYLRSGSDLFRYQVSIWPIRTRKDLDLMRIYGSDPELRRRPILESILEG